MPLGHGFYLWQLITYQFMHATSCISSSIWSSACGCSGWKSSTCGVQNGFSLSIWSAGSSPGFRSTLLAPILEPTSVVDRSGQGYPDDRSFGRRLWRACCVRDDVPRPIHLHLFPPARSRQNIFIFGLIVFGVLSVGGQGAIANLAHLGGAAAGYVYVLILARHFPFQRFIEQIGWLINARTV